jgi:hypothetical protein
MTDQHLEPREVALFVFFMFPEKQANVWRDLLQLC